jgi:hypothetical protein
MTAKATKITKEDREVTAVDNQIIIVVFANFVVFVAPPSAVIPSPLHALEAHRHPQSSADA